MAIELPPEIYFDGIIYNPDNYPNAEDATGLSQSTADARYLIKTLPDSATALETFTLGIETPNVNALDPSSFITIAETQTSAPLYIASGSVRNNAAPVFINSILSSDASTYIGAGTGDIVINTTNTGNTNASPAISIGTSATTKTIKINNTSSSVHCSAISLQVLEI